MVELTAELLEVTKLVLDKPQRWVKGTNYGRGRVCLFGAMGIASHMGSSEMMAANKVGPSLIKDPNEVMRGCCPEQDDVFSLYDVQDWQDKKTTTFKELHQFLDDCIAELRK